MREINLQYLRDQLRLSEKQLKHVNNLKLKDITPEDLHYKDYLIGQISVYHDMIRYVRNLNYGEFLVLKRKNKL